MPLIVLKGIRGGVGTTSIAVALARQFHQQNKEVLIIDNCTDNLLSFYFPEIQKQQSLTLGQALLERDPIRSAVYEYKPGYRVLPLGLVNVRNSLLLQLSFSIKQRYNQFLATFMQLNPNTFIFMDLQNAQDELTASWIDKADIYLTVAIPESNCHIRLSQHEFSEHEHVLVNQFIPTSQVHQDFYQFWQTTSFPLCPVPLHRDEVAREASASRIPLQDYRKNSVLAEEIAELADWCSSLLVREKGLL